MLRILPRTSPAPACAVVLSIVASPCPGEPAPRPLDQGYEDVSPLAASLRVVDESQRADTDFTRLYRGDGFLLRRSGALTATFEQSSYIATPWGTAPLIPAGTVFHIGEPAQATVPVRAHTGPPEMDRLVTESATRRISSKQEADSRSRRITPVPVWLSEMVEEGDAAQRPVTQTPAPRRPTIGDESYRRLRLEAIASSTSDDARAPDQERGNAGALVAVLGQDLYERIAPAMPGYSTALLTRERDRRAMLARVANPDE